MRLGARAKTDLPKPQHIAVSIGLGVGNANDVCMGNANTKALGVSQCYALAAPYACRLALHRLANVCALNVGLRKSKGLGFAKHNHCEGGQTQ